MWEERIIDKVGVVLTTRCKKGRRRNIIDQKMDGVEVYIREGAGIAGRTEWKASKGETQR